MDSLDRTTGARLDAVALQAAALSLADAAWATPAWAARQPGKDGAFTASTSGTVVNLYARLATDAAASSTTLALGAVAGRCTLDPATLLADDLLLVIQMQGATISTVDDATYGAVTSLNGAGRFEFVTVRSVAGSTVTIDPARVDWVTKRTEKLIG